MKKFRLILLLSVLFISPVPGGSSNTRNGDNPGKPGTEQEQQRPLPTYKVPGSVLTLFRDETHFKILMTRVKADLLSHLEKYDIQDKPLLEKYYVFLTMIHMLGENYDGAHKYVQLEKELEEDPVKKLVIDLFSAPWIKAKKAGGKNFKEAFSRELRERLKVLPHEEKVKDYLVKIRMSVDMISEDWGYKLIEMKIQPGVKNGMFSQDMAMMLIEIKFLVKVILPLKGIITSRYGEFLETGNGKKKQALEESIIDLGAGENLAPVVITVWDTGVDIDIFKEQLFVNKNEIPGNNKDDDNNGYVDDIHGIAYTLDNEPAASLLNELTDDPAAILEYKKYLKGLLDYSAGIDSGDFNELLKKKSSLTREDFDTFLKGMSRYISYLHGTYMSGIALRGNPAARLLVARFTEDLDNSENPTLETAKKTARAETDIIAYFKKNNVRVVNISWSRDLSQVENLLASHQEGIPPEKREQLAQEIFAVGADSLKKNMAGAPAILFVVSSGFQGENVIPAAFELPNIIRVGALGKGGETRTFTGFRHVDIYAEAEDVPGVVPGGDKFRLSGGSMAAPVVTNLAAALLALYPELTAAGLKKIILDGADLKTFSNNITGKILNPQKSLQIAGNSRFANPQKK